MGDPDVEEPDYSPIRPVSVAQIAGSPMVAKWDYDRVAQQLAGAVEALREAIEAARLFNRSGMTWREYDALLARLEHDHLRGQ
jgi:hypothetical protein